MQDRQTAGVTAVEHALTEQLTAIKQAAQQGLINSAQALVLWKRARRDRETDNKKAILSNSVCTTERVETHDFEVRDISVFPALGEVSATCLHMLAHACSQHPGPCCLVY